MPTRIIPPERSLDLTSANDTISFYVGRHDMLRVQTVLASGAFGTAEVSMEVSIDGQTWYDWPEHGAITFTSATLSSAYYLDAIGLVRFIVSTADAGAGTLDVYVCASSTGLDETRSGDL